MLEFTLIEVLLDIFIVFCCFASMTAIAIAVLFVLYGRRKEGTFGDYLKKEFQRPLVHYGIAALALFFAAYATHLVVVRMILALCYVFLIARIFLRSDPR